LSRKLIFATGIKDILPDIPGANECWGISLLHCPYCHGYEVRGKKTGILANGDSGFEQAMLISNWTNDLTLYTNGQSGLSATQSTALRNHNIQIVETEINELLHINGQIKQIVFKDNTTAEIGVIYSRRPFTQHCTIPESLDCELTPDGYLKIDSMFKTTAPGIYACGDNASRMRTVANAVAMGAGAGIAINKELIEESFFEM
ncbi:MAG: NAD(P)/FAD-dependent oxidoreductase, partial [Bacteroidetes bacterium]|nr:NAD(P)/FAD-dependent oxidoreductase [Bacteroidota bacterium]